MEVEAHAHRAAQVQKIVVQILWLNLLVAVAKAVYAWRSHSLAVASDAIHSFLDAGSNVIGMIALRYAESPPDEEHPYGHRKIEIIAATTIGVMIAAGSVRFGWSAISALISGKSDVNVTPIGFVVMIGTFLVNVFVARYEAAKGRKLGSAFLVADAAHTASDLFVTMAVLASLVGSRLGQRWADPVGGLVVLVIVARVAWRILGENLGILLDRAALDAGEVKGAVLAVTGVTGCHRVRSRGIEGATIVDLHVTVDGDVTLREAHEVSHAVETLLKDKFPTIIDVTIHVEPDGEPEESL